MHQADVIVAVDRNTALLPGCIQSVLEHGGCSLRRLILAGELSRQPRLVEWLSSLPSIDARVVLVDHATRLSDVESCNRGLAKRAGDAILLSAFEVVSEGWLRELAAVVHSEERTACASPLTSSPETCRVLGPGGDAIRADSIETTVRAACAGLPRWTVAPVVPGSCIYLRGDVIDAVGLLDESFASLAAAVADWVLRAQNLGFIAKRANHVFVQPASLLAPRAESGRVDELDEPLPKDRRPHLEPQLVRARDSLDSRLVDHAVRLEATGKLQVAYDIRHIPPEQVGTRTYAVSLALALAELPELELTLLVRDPAQAKGLTGRIVTSEQWRDDVAVVHKPSQVIDPRELKLLFESSAHVVITYLDLISYRIPLVFPSEAKFEAYRTASKLSLSAVQRVIAISASAGREIAAEFGIPAEEIPSVALGVEAEWFADRPARDDRLIRSALRLPERYFFSVASDYPHKNLRTLLDAYAQLRSRWKTGEPPWLVLAGYPSGARTGLYPSLESEPLDRGVIFLGPVSQRQLRALYQHALALVFSSLYEGFGLPILEAMAAGAPVIAMPISAVPEVGGDCVLYSEGLRAADLASAMQRLADSEPLRLDLREKGLKWVEHFRWEKTARATLEVYRSTVLRPSERSLRLRRQLRDVIIDWSENRQPQAMRDPSDRAPGQMPPSMGIRNAWRGLRIAVRSRLKRELRRFPPIVGRRTA